MKRLILLVLPCLFLLLSGESAKNKGPFWLSTNLDPEYAYLLNSYNFAELKMVGHVDHPGTTMQVFGAAVLTVDRLLSKKDLSTYRKSLILNPEVYLNRIISVIIFITFLSLFYTGKMVYQVTESYFKAAFFQFSFFLFPSIFWWFSFRFCAEPFLLLASLWLCCYSYCFYLNKTRLTEEKYTFISSIILGFGIVSKMVFAPMFLMPFFLVRKLKSKIKLFLLTLLFFLIFVSPILDKFNNFTRFMRDIFLHKGHYGTGEKGFIDFTLVNNFINSLWVSHWLFIVIPLIAIMLYLSNHRRTQVFKLKNQRLIGSLLISLIFLYAMVIKHPDTHYLISAIIPLGLLLILYSEKFLVKIIMIFIFITHINQLVSLYKGSQNKTADINEELKTISQLVDQNCTTIINSTSHPLKALAFGNHFSTKRYTDDLNAIYKNTYILISPEQVKNWSEETLNFASILKSAHCVFVVGEALPNTKLNLHYKGKINSVYKLIK